MQQNKSDREIFHKYLMTLENHSQNSNDSSDNAIQQIIDQLTKIINFLRYEQIQLLDQYDLENIAYELTNIKKTIQTYSKSEIIDNKDIYLKSYSELANRNLIQQMVNDQFNYPNLSINELAKNTIMVWTDIIVEITKLTVIPPNSNYYQEVMNIIFKKERLFYIGISIVLISFLLYVFIIFD